MCVRERERECVCVSERESVCVCVREREGEREKLSCLTVMCQKLSFIEQWRPSDASNLLHSLHIQLKKKKKRPAIIAVLIAL